MKQPDDGKNLKHENSGKDVADVREGALMKYLAGRSLFYYFLMREITDLGTELWEQIAKDFGLSPKLIKSYGKVLCEPVLDDLSMPEDIEVYKNYLSGFCCDRSSFGKSEIEMEAVDAKALALRKVQQLFGNVQIGGNELQTLSRIYEGDRSASVLYALHIIHFNADKSCRKYAEDILFKELHDGKNSDAGFILLQLKGEEADKTAACLKSLPDVWVNAEIMQYLTDKYGGSGEIISPRRSIGF